MNTSTLILGGARSGKSARAAIVAESLLPQSIEADSGDRPLLLVATAEAFDAEMIERIDRHRADRSAQWQVVEEPVDLVGVLQSKIEPHHVCVVDCLTIWLSNLFHYERDIEASVNALVAAVSSLAAPIVFVSNEVGLGIVPESALGRAFRDAQGRLNQQLAAVCDTVEFVIAGIPMTLKEAR
ncbi:MAG: bifunctional adenosylcobinamide kinase/adenosylcobinamide-phosphate guanylyltransferase [Pseudomonadota bacterium]